jgi:hypothetical protein
VHARKRYWSVESRFAELAIWLVVRFVVANTTAYVHASDAMKAWFYRHD